MRLCFVYDAVHPWETGGVQKRVWEIARRLATDHDVHWYGLHYWDGPAVVEREGVTLHGVGEPRELYVDGRRSITEALYFARKLLGPLARDEFDVIDCQAFPYFSCYATLPGAVLHDATFLVTWHEVWESYWYDCLGWKGVFGDVIERGTVHLPDEHVCVSRRTGRDLADLGGVRSHLVPNGIDLEYVAGAEPAEERVDAVYVGRLIPEKGPVAFVEAVDALRDRLPDVRCRVVGEGPERERVERTIAERDLSDAVELLGFLDSHEAVFGTLKAADAFVLPSRREGFGITALEALAAGTPVVTADHPRNAAADLVDHGETGRVVERHPEAIARGIERATADVDPADCRAAAADYDWDRIADRAETLYREVSA